MSSLDGDERFERRLARLGRATSGVGAPPGLEDRIRAALAERAADDSTWRTAWSWLRASTLVAASAAVASVAIAAYVDSRFVTSVSTSSSAVTEGVSAEP